MTKLKVFISWSQSDSKQIAKILKEELEVLFNYEIDFFVSTEDIGAGSVGFNVIIEALRSSQIIIVCLDSSNYRRSWLYFETGMIFGLNHDPVNIHKPVVYPIIFDELPISNVKETPFSDLQLMKFEKDKFRKMVEDINCYYKKITKKELLHTKTMSHHFENTWNNLFISINNIIVQRNDGDDQMLSIDNIVEKLKDYSEFPVAKHGQTIQYEYGFETVAFYKFLLKNTQKRLYIFGRKNRKLSSTDFNQDFIALVQKKLDIQILYLNPNSKEAHNGSAQDIKNFRNHLILSIQTMSERFDKNKWKMEEFCKMYDGQRDSEVIVADDVVFYKDLGYSVDGKPVHFTNGSFNVVSVDSAIGSHYFKKFSEVWSAAQVISTEIADSLKL